MADAKTNVPGQEASSRPDPIATVDSAFFWDGAARGELLIQQCCGCDTLWHPPRPMCPKCYCVEKRYTKMSGHGTVYSWSMPIHPPAYGFETPPIVALIDLEEGVRIVSNVIGVDAREMKSGIAVEVAFAPTRGGKAVPVFHPAKERG